MSVAVGTAVRTPMARDTAPDVARRAAADAMLSLLDGTPYVALRCVLVLPLALREARREAAAVPCAPVPTATYAPLALLAGCPRPSDADMHRARDHSVESSASDSDDSSADDSNDDDDMNVDHSNRPGDDTIDRSSDDGGGGGRYAMRSSGRDRDGSPTSYDATSLGVTAGARWTDFVDARSAMPRIAGESWLPLVAPDVGAALPRSVPHGVWLPRARPVDGDAPAGVNGTVTGGREVYVPLRFAHLLATELRALAAGAR